MWKQRSMGSISRNRRPISSKEKKSGRWSRFSMSVNKDKCNSTLFAGRGIRAPMIRGNRSLASMLPISSQRSKRGRRTQYKRASQEAEEGTTPLTFAV
jgi:hypothetical protein